MPFIKGQSGNPNGRPPKIVEDAQHSVLNEIFNETEERAVVKAQVRQAKKGDTTAATWLWDRKYGKLKDRVAQSGELVIRYEYVDPDTDDPEASAP